MQTGYDNFWIYQNSRHEPVRNLPNNDNCIYPVLTDNYKARQGGGCPSNTIVTSLNNVANSQNGQFSTVPHCMWPSSVYSLPFNSSCANNFHSQMFPTQSNNLNYSSQLSQPKATVRNSNINIPQKSKGDNQRNVTGRLPQISHCTDTETARIRVKDVFTLNNNSIYNSMSDNLVQTQKNKQCEYSFNCAANNCNRTCDFETTLPMSKHFSSSFVQREQPFLNNQQQFLQYSGPPYQANAQISSGSQIQSNGSIQRENNLQAVGFKSKSSLIMQLLKSNKNQEEVQNDFCNALNGNKRVTVRPKGTNNLSSLKTVNSQFNAERTNNIVCYDSAQVNEKLTYDGVYTKSFPFVQDQTQNQLSFSDKSNHDQAFSLPQISPVEDSREKQITEQIVTSDTKNFSNSLINSLEDNVVKITIPNSSQSTYTNPAVEPNIRNRNSSLSLPNLLESHDEILLDEFNKTNTQNYIQDIPLPESIQVRRHSCNTSPGSSHVYNVSPQSIPNGSNSTARDSNCIYYNKTSPRNSLTPPQRFQQESFDNLRRQENQKAFVNSKNCSENTPETFSINICNRNENIKEFVKNSNKTESIFQGETVLIDTTIKQEISSLGVDSSSMQPDQNIMDRAFKEIKIEKNSEDFELEQKRLPSENSDHAKEILSNSDDSRNIDSNKNEESIILSKKIIPESKTMSTGCKNVENCTPELEISINNLNEDNKTEKNIADQEATAEKAKTFIEDGNYVCKINRDKLDLLIQFLKKDDELAKTRKSEESDLTVNTMKIIEGNKKKEEDNLIRSRRKLSKTHIVKNKNNSREMVSLMSHKTSRAEIQDPSKRSQSAKTDGNSNKEERKSCCSDDIKTNERDVDSHEYEKQKEFESKSEAKIKNSSVSSQTQESSIDEEKNIVNIMQALQSLKSHFCLSCTLVSPIESFWINVISGELRCLNCFKKMTSKTDEKVFKLNKACSDVCNSTEPKPFPYDKIQRGNENKRDSKFEVVCSKCNCGCDSEKSNELKVNIKQETVNESAKEKIVHTSSEKQSFIPKYKNLEMKDAVRTDVPRKKSFEEQKKLRVEESEENSEKNSTTKDFIPKTNFLEESSKLEIKTKRNHSVKEDSAPDKIQNSEEKASLVKSRKKSISEESQAATSTSTVNHSKQWSDFLEKKTASKEAIGSPKTKVTYDRLKKEKKLFSQSEEKGNFKEQYFFHKTQISKEALEQEIRSNSEKSIKESLSKEENVLEIGKKDKKQYKDLSQSRKRTNSEEEIGFHKVQISEEETMDAFAMKSPSRESFDSHKMYTSEGILKRSTNESLYKSRIYSFSKESSAEHKAKISPKCVKPKHTSSLDDLERKNMSAYKNFEKEKSAESVDQLRKRRKSSEELIPRKIRIVEEGSKEEKLGKQFFEKSYSEITSSSKIDEVGFSNKTSEHSKHLSIDLAFAPRRKSKDEWLPSKEQPKSEMKNFTDSSDKKRKNSTSKESLSSPEHSKKEIKYENFMSGNNEKEKKYFSRKTPKISHKNLEKDSFYVFKTSSNDDKHKKSSLASKPLKESQRTESEHKISSPTQVFKKKELHGTRHKHKEQSDRKIEEKRKNERQKTVEAGNKFEKKHALEQEGSKKQRYNKSHTRQSKKDRALECIFGRKKEDSALNEFRKVGSEGGKPPSGKLLERLIKKTKKFPSSAWSQS